ncbi:MAG: hypothetical protein N2517_08220 [Ignavibacteria bacterium]|nr:hypothetical protein [Ignavibacteria bacterium]
MSLSNPTGTMLTAYSTKKPVEKAFLVSFWNPFLRKPELKGWFLKEGFNTITRSLKQSDIKLVNDIFVHNSHIHAVIEVKPCEDNPGFFNYFIYNNKPPTFGVWSEAFHRTTNEELVIVEIYNQNKLIQYYFEFDGMKNSLFQKKGKRQYTKREILHNNVWVNKLELNENNLVVQFDENDILYIGAHRFKLVPLSPLPSELLNFDPPDVYVFMVETR